MRSACEGLRERRARVCYRARALDDASDAELVNWIASAEPKARAAEAALCRRYAPRVRLYGLKHLRDEERARELTQIVLLGVLEAARAKRIEDPDRLERFVLGTCRNSVARLRQQAARVSLVSDATLAELQLPVLPELRVETTGLWTCLAALEERARRILMLSFMEERSADAIAVTLATSSGNVRVIRHRALAAVRKCLDAREAAP